MTTFEFLCALIGLGSPLVIVIIYGLKEIITGGKDNEDGCRNNHPFI